jgi:hypothetical protein
MNLLMADIAVFSLALFKVSELSENRPADPAFDPGLAMRRIWMVDVSDVTPSAT